MKVRYDQNVHRRKSIRLKGYDYSQAGTYFVTVVTRGHLCLFGDLVDGEMVLNEAGEMVQRVWEEMPGRFPNIEMDTFIVMPNHIHGIVITNYTVGASLVGAQGSLGQQHQGNHKGCPYGNSVAWAFYWDELI